MNDNVEGTHVPDSVDRQRHAVRFLVDDPVLGWRLFSLERALLAYQGDLKLPEYTGCALRIAFAHVEVVGGHLTRLMRLECSEWLLDGEGRVDQDKLMREIVESIDPVTGPINFKLLASVPMADEDIIAIQRRLGIQRDPC